MTTLAALALAVTVVGAVLLCGYCAWIVREARASQRLLETNMQRLALRTRIAVDADRTRARKSADVAEAAMLLSERILAVQRSFAVQRARPTLPAPGRSRPEAPPHKPHLST